MVHLVGRRVGDEHPQEVVGRAEAPPELDDLVERAVPDPAADDVRRTPRRGTNTRLDVLVPRRARTGRILLLASAGVRSISP